MTAKRVISVLPSHRRGVLRADSALSAARNASAAPAPFPRSGDRSHRPLARPVSRRGESAKALLPAYLWAVILIACLFGCGYRLETKADLPFETVTIGTIDNSTFEPKLQDRLSRALADTFMEYGISVVPSSRHVVQAKVTRFELRTLSEINLTTSEYELIIAGDFLLTDASSGDTLRLMNLRNPYLTYFFATGSIENALAQKEIATDAALRDLSREVVRRAVYRPRSEKEAPR